MNTATELLRRALSDLEWSADFCGNKTLLEEIRTFLDSETEAEPVAWLCCEEGRGCLIFGNGSTKAIASSESKTINIPLYPTKHLLECKPFAWTNRDELNALEEDGYSLVYDGSNQDDNVPLYLHPPRPEPAIRKPMTEEEVDVGFNPYRMRWLADDQYFVAGVRWAEKFHFGIGGDE